MPPKEDCDGRFNAEYVTSPEAARAYATATIFTVGSLAFRAARFAID